MRKEKMRPKGIWRGALYDIGFDKPEAHAGNYLLRDYVNDRPLGQVNAAKNPVVLSFEHALLVEALPA